MLGRSVATSVGLSLDLLFNISLVLFVIGLADYGCNGIATNVA